MFRTLKFFDQNFDFWPTFRFLDKISIADQNFDFCSKFRFFNKISIFDQNLDFWQTLRFLNKMSILDQKKKWVRITSTFSVLRQFSYLRPFLYFVRFTSTRVLRPLYFDLFTSTSLLRLAYFKLCTSTRLLRHFVKSGFLIGRSQAGGSKIWKWSKCSKCGTGEYPKMTIFSNFWSAFFRQKQIKNIFRKN